jgi:RNA polymerase sigma-70 factor (family 1)
VLFITLANEKYLFYVNELQRYNERELLQKLHSGSEDAFRILFNAYRDKLYTYIFKLSGSIETAEDTVHDIFLKLWQRRDQILEIENLNAYLYRMAHNLAFNVFRRMAKETLIMAELQREQGSDAGFEAEERITHSEVTEFIKVAVNKLPPQQKLVFLMSRNEGLKLSEIAERLNIAERTVKNHMGKALQFLREEIARSYDSCAVILFVLHYLGGF